MQKRSAIESFQSVRRLFLSTSQESFPFSRNAAAILSACGDFSIGLDVPLIPWFLLLSIV